VNPPAISVEELKVRLDRKDEFVILDVREPYEVALCNLGGTHIPLGQLPARLAELDRNREILVLCHHGSRSWRATLFLLESGFSNVKNITGGIDAWSEYVDPSVKRY
jgi:sulfur-carrier protein adenylyltransferase/sulfurtransferase